jgi:hypothetical protein
VANSVVNTTTATPPFTALDAELLAGAGPAGQDIYRERVQITGAVLAEIARVLNTVIAGTEYALVTRNIPTIVGAQANAWNAAVVAANGTSTAIDTQFVPNISIFGNTNGATMITIQLSQDNVNFYDGTTTNANGDFSASGIFGARYLRLKSSQARTITATIAGKG